MTLSPASFKKGEFLIRLSKHPEDTLHRPSVDVLFQSVLKYFGRRTIAVLLTGMGDDGAQSMVDIKRAGGRTIAEDESSAVVFGMPREAIERGGAEFILPCDKISSQIVSLVEEMVSDKNNFREGVPT